MEPFTFIFAVVLVVLAIILSVVSIYIILVLVEMKRALKKINGAINQTETKFNKIVASTGSLGGVISGMQIGSRLFKAFLNKASKNKNEKK